MHGLLTLIRSRFAAALLGGFSSDEGPAPSWIVGTADDFSILFLAIPNWECSLVSMKSSSLKWALQTTLDSDGPLHCALVNLTLAIHIRRTFSSLGNRWRLTPSFVVLLHPATTHLEGIFAKNPIETYQREATIHKWYTPDNTQYATTELGRSGCDATGHMIQRTRYRGFFSSEYGIWKINLKIWMQFSTEFSNIQYPYDLYFNWKGHCFIKLVNL